MRLSVGANLVFALLYVLPAGRVLTAKRAITRIAPTVTAARSTPLFFSRTGSRECDLFL